MKPLIFLILFNLICSCNFFYKSATGFRRPKIESHESIIGFVKKNKLEPGDHLLVNSKNFFDRVILLSLSPEQIWLFDSNGAYTKVPPGNVTAEMLRMLTPRTKLKEKYEIEFNLLSQKTDSLNFLVLSNLNFDSLLIKTSNLNIFPKSDGIEKTQTDFYVVIPWKIYEGKKYQLKYIHGCLESMLANTKSKFKIYFLNLDFRSDIENANTYVNTFELKRVKRK